jgi:hypothetical protein
MSISLFLRDEPFDAELLNAMSGAFVEACTSLGVSSHADPATELIAQQIIDAAGRGIRSKRGLYLSAISKFKSKPH